MKAQSKVGKVFSVCSNLQGFVSYLEGKIHSDQTKVHMVPRVATQTSEISLNDNNNIRLIVLIKCYSTPACILIMPSLSITPKND